MPLYGNDLETGLPQLGVGSLALRSMDGQSRERVGICEDCRRHGRGQRRVEGDGAYRDVHATRQPPFGPLPSVSARSQDES